MSGSTINSSTTANALGVRLKDESWCLSYAFKRRWPKGFVCPTCGAAHPGSGCQEKPLCRACGRSSSITAGTLLHGSKKSLSTWLQAFWWVSGERTSISIKKLLEYLGFKSFQTGWAWMKIVRRTIELANQKKCRGVVLVDAVPIDCQGKGDQLLCALESIARGRTIGRLHMKVHRSVNQEVITRFCEQTVEPGSVAVFPGRAPFISVRLEDILCTVDDSCSCHEDIARICSSFRRWRRTCKGWSWHQGCSQDLLEEFCFFHNGMLSSSRGHIFDTLVAAALTVPAAHYGRFREPLVRPGGAV